MRSFITLLFTLLSILSQAQNKPFTMSEAVVGQYRELYPSYFNNLQWRGTSNKFTFQDYNFIYEQTLRSNDSTILISLKEINAAIKTIDTDTLTYLPNITWENNNEFHFYAHNTWYAYSIIDKKIIAVIQLPETADNMSLFYEKMLIAFTIDNNLLVADTQEKIYNITNFDDRNIVSGQSVSRNEFGIDGGIFWSPNGNYIAFYQKNVSNVRNYPLVNISARQAELNNIKYPMAGMASEHVSLGVYSISNKKSIYIEANDTITEKYLTNISWNPSEEHIYIQVLNRAQNLMKLNRYNVKSGKYEKTLFEEKHEKYVEPHSPLLFIPEKTDQFIYQTRTYGYNHAYLYNTDGKLLKNITNGDWEITEIIHLSSSDLYYMSTEQSPIERHLYRVNLSSEKKVKLTENKGTHNITFNKNEKYFISSYSNTTTPRVTEIISTKGSSIRKALIAKNPLLDYKMPSIEIGTIKAADNKTDIYYRLIKPNDFDSTKKYPAIIYVYGGPHAQLIENRWLAGARMWNYLMAQKGYIMLTIDNRGSAHRGLEFENVIHRQCGVNEVKDQIKGIEYLKSLNYVDHNKIGVHGWSYGGFMTTSLMTQHADIFKVGVAGGPVIDWKYYEVMYGERYMDTPDENPDGYLYTSLIPRAKDLKGKLLLIHGGIDPVVVMQHSQLFISECIKNKVPVDYFIYPEAEHNVRGYDRIHLMQKVTDYFDDYLK